MPINTETHTTLGFTGSNELYETIDDLSQRFGISKSQFIRQAVKEKIWNLRDEVPQDKLLTL